LHAGEKLRPLQVAWQELMVTRRRKRQVLKKMQDIYDFLFDINPVHDNFGVSQDIGGPTETLPRLMGFPWR